MLPLLFLGPTAHAYFELGSGFDDAHFFLELGVYPLGSIIRRFPRTADP